MLPALRFRKTWQYEEGRANLSKVHLVRERRKMLRSSFTHKNIPRAQSVRPQVGHFVILARVIWPLSLKPCPFLVY
jgi:hypothetical protein